jgi:hypothetical protein
MTNLFYDMQCKFKNKVVLPKKTQEVHFFNFPEHVFSWTSVIRISTDLDKSSLRISEVLLYAFGLV